MDFFFKDTNYHKHLQAMRAVKRENAKYPFYQNAFHHKFSDLEVHSLQADEEIHQPIVMPFAKSVYSIGTLVYLSRKGGSLMQVLAFAAIPVGFLFVLGPRLITEYDYWTLSSPTPYGAKVRAIYREKAGPDMEWFANLSDEVAKASHNLGDVPAHIRSQLLVRNRPTFLHMTKNGVIKVEFRKPEAPPQSIHGERDIVPASVVKADNFDSGESSQQSSFFDFNSDPLAILNLNNSNFYQPTIVNDDSNEMFDTGSKAVLNERHPSYEKRKLRREELTKRME